MSERLPIFFPAVELDSFTKRKDVEEDGVGVGFWGGSVGGLEEDG